MRENHGDDRTRRLQVGHLTEHQADARRQASSGVNTDEELIQMMKAQQAYTAAAKMIKVVDEMTATLLQLV